MSKDIFEIINPTNTLGVCRPLAHILGACETIVYNALLLLSVREIRQTHRKSYSTSTRTITAHSFRQMGLTAQSTLGL